MTTRTKITRTKSLVALAAAGLALTGAVAHADNDKSHGHHYAKGHSRGQYRDNSSRDQGRHRDSNYNGDQGRHQDNGSRDQGQHRGDNNGQHRGDNHNGDQGQHQDNH